MDNLINETNARIQEIIDNLETIKNEYENKLDANIKTIEEELSKVKKYKEDFFTSKAKIEKMNADIDGFEEDYKNLVERFKDDELANILIAANKEISAKIEERKRKIVKDTAAMNELVEKAESVKKRLVKLTAEKKALELCLDKINDSYEFYSKALGQVVDYSEDNREYLCACFYEEKETLTTDSTNEEDIETVDYDTSSASLDEETFTEEELMVVEETINEDTDNEENFIEEDLIIPSDVLEEEDIPEDENTSYEDKESDNLDEEIIDTDNLDESFIDDYNDNLNSIDLDDIPEIELDDINDDSINEDESENEEVENTDTAEETEDLENTDDNEVIEGEEHEVIIDEMPSQDYDFNASLDLENIINFDDSLEDDDSLYENKKEEDI